MAASALRISSSASPGSWVASSPLRAMPMLGRTDRSLPCTEIGISNPRTRRSARSIAIPGSLTSSIKMANSSPPNRAAVSISRTASSRRPATCRSTSSPAAWPRLSLIVLKSSRSRKMTAMLPASRVGASEGVLDAVGEQGAVGKAGHGIVERLVRQLLLERSALAGVAGVEHDAADVLVIAEVGGDDLECDRATIAVNERAVERLRARAAGADRLQELAQPPAFGGHQQVLEARSGDVGGAEAEDPLDRRALVENLPVATHDRDQVTRVPDERCEARLVLAPMRLLGERRALQCQRDACAQRVERVHENRRERCRRRSDQQAALVLAGRQRKDVGVVEAGWQIQLAVHVARKRDAGVRCRGGLLEQRDGRRRQDVFGAGRGRHHHEAGRALDAQAGVARAADEQLRRSQRCRADLGRCRRLDECEVREPERALASDGALVLPHEAQTRAITSRKTTIDAATMTSRSKSPRRASRTNSIAGATRDATVSGPRRCQDSRRWRSGVASTNSPWTDAVLLRPTGGSRRATRRRRSTGGCRSRPAARSRRPRRS